MLRCFRAVAEQGSLADAAEVLGRTPSAVSMMLRQFEDHIGAPLFESARKSRLTPLGELIHAEARRELDHFDRTITAIEGMSRAEAGHVRLAVTPSVGQVIMPSILRSFMAAHPGVHVDMRDSHSAAVQDDLAAGRADIGLATLPPMPGFERHLIFTDRFGVVCRSDHPLARDWSDLRWSDLTATSSSPTACATIFRTMDFCPCSRRRASTWPTPPRCSVWCALAQASRYCRNWPCSAPMRIWPFCRFWTAAPGAKSGC